MKAAPYAGGGPDVPLAATRTVGAVAVRVQRRVPNPKNLPARPAAVGACLLALLVSGCSHGHSNAPAPTASTATQSASAARSTHLLRIGKVDVESAGRAVRPDVTTQRAVLATAQRYVDDAILTPLETGRLGPGYAQLFAGSIRPAAIGIDRARLTDLGVGPTTTFTETSTPVTLSVLTDPSGALLYAATDFRVDVDATTSRGRITISRRVELTIERDGSAWFVVAYRTTVTRTAPAATRTTPTTRRSGPGTTRPGAKKKPKP